MVDTLPSPLLDPSQVQINQTSKLFGTQGTLLALNIKRGQRGMLKLQDGTRKRDKLQLLTQTCIKPTNKLVSSFSRAPLVLGQAMGNLELTRLTTTRARGKPSPSLIQYSCFVRGTYIRMAFCPGTPKEESRNCPDLDSQDFARS